MLRAPRASDRDRLFELLQDPDEQRYGVPSFVSQPDSCMHGIVAPS